MPIPGEIQNFNGVNGEDITRSILSKRFWCLERRVDIEGADFLVQLRVDAIDELPSRKSDIFVLGIVQSKFFQEGTTLKIKKEYVLDNEGEPIKQFFLMCHTNDAEENTHTYFFTSDEIKKSLTFDLKNNEYKFHVGIADSYVKYKDRPVKEVLDAIALGIVEAKEQKNNDYVSRLFFYHRESSRNYGIRHFYLLRNVEKVAVVFSQNSESGVAELLEPRRDIFNNFGGFQWGYEGSGPRFLVNCLLTHMRDGQHPSSDEVNFVLSWILNELESGKDWDIAPEIIEAHLKGSFLFQSQLINLCEPSKSFEERVIKLSVESVTSELNQTRRLITPLIENCRP